MLSLNQSGKTEGINQVQLDDPMDASKTAVIEALYLVVLSLVTMEVFSGITSPATIIIAFILL